MRGFSLALDTFAQISAPIKLYLRSVSDRLWILSIILFEHKYE